MQSIPLSTEQEVEAKALEAKIQAAVQREIADLARLMVSKSDRELLGQTEKFTVGLTDHEPSEVGDLPLNGRLDFRFQGLGFNFLFRGQWDRLHVVSPSGLPPKPSWQRLVYKNTTNYSAAYPSE